jgi:hypothetical protein
MPDEERGLAWRETPPESPVRRVGEGPLFAGGACDACGVGVEAAPVEPALSWTLDTGVEATGTERFGMAEYDSRIARSLA